MSYPSDLTRTKNWGTEILTDADLEGQLDLIINWAMAVVNASTGHTHDGTSNNGPKIPITNLTVGSQAQGDLIYASSATAWARLGYGTAGYLLKTQGTGANPAWVNIAADSTYLPAGSVIQIVNTQNVTSSTGTTAIPFDDTIPQNTEGDEYMTLAITPTHASNKLKIDVIVQGGPTSSAAIMSAALFQDSTAGALAASCTNNLLGNTGGQVVFTHFMVAGTTSETTFKVRAGTENAGITFRLNGADGSRRYGGVMATSMTITEIKA